MLGKEYLDKLNKILEGAQHCIILHDKCRTCPYSKELNCYKKLYNDVEKVINIPMAYVKELIKSESKSNQLDNKTIWIIESKSNQLDKR